MGKRILNFCSLVAISLVIINCANRGNPSGGEKDSTPPVITKATPENFSTNFKATEIKIYFDEYIKIKNLQKNLIISPPMDPEPQITPLGSASKDITIKIFDTLSPNTTYAFNFGESIVDNNEENPYPYYKYVFSTGDFIDSLSVSGILNDALDRVTEEFVSVMLYEVDSSFTDSVIYKKKPNYITNTLDSTSMFQLDNLKAGEYLMIALKDENNNYTFQQKVDKIGFVDNFITIPTDDFYGISIFKENVDFKAFRPFLASDQKIAFGYEGDYNDLNIKLLSITSSDFKSTITKDQKQDTLLFWYKPKLEIDSLNFEVRGKTTTDTFTVKMKDQLKDTLVIKSLNPGVASFDDPYEIEANIPFEAFDRDQITLLDKDSTNITFSTSLDTLNNRFQFHFEKTESNIYKLQLLPGAITDFFGNTNDSLTYSIRTRALSDYGNVRLVLKNGKYPMIVQLINQSNAISAEKYATIPEPLDFKNLDPGNYYIRVIYDTNGNGKYDPGNYLKKQQPERVSYFPEPLDVRASWNFIEEFTLKD